MRLKTGNKWKKIRIFLTRKPRKSKPQAISFFFKLKEIFLLMNSFEISK